MLSSPETKLAASDHSPGSSSTSMRWGLPCGRHLRIHSYLQQKWWLQGSKMAASEEQIELVNNTGTMLDVMCKQLHTHTHKLPAWCKAG